MATIHVNRGGTGLGTFSEDEVREGLRSGRFIGTDLGWREGMAQWQPLSQMPEFAAGAPAGPPPSTSPEAAATLATSTSSGVTPRSGLPWENRTERGFFSAFVETLQMILTKPGQAFSIMRAEGDFGGPLLYAVIGGIIGVVVWFVFSICLNSLGFLGHREDALGSLFGMTASVMMLMWKLVVVAVAPFIFGALVHVSLMLLGGARKSFETTFRVIAFSQGSTAPLQLVPCCGGPIAFVWFLVANCIGIARAHEIDTGRATLAVFLPLLVCCGGGLLVLFLVGGLAALGLQSGQ